MNDIISLIRGLLIGYVMLDLMISKAEKNDTIRAVRYLIILILYLILEVIG